MERTEAHAGAHVRQAKENLFKIDPSYRGEVRGIQEKRYQNVKFLTIFSGSRGLRRGMTFNF